MDYFNNQYNKANNRVGEIYFELTFYIVKYKQAHKYFLSLLEFLFRQCSDLEREEIAM